MKSRVLVLGDLNADLIVTGFSDPQRPGREVLVRGCSFTLGGSAAIFAAGVARLGRPVSFRGKVGKDATGDFLVDLFRRRGVDVSGIVRDPRVPTGLAMALSYTPDRALVSFLGTIATTRRRDVEPRSWRGFAHLHLTSPFLQKGLRPHFPDLLRKARRAGLSTSLDTGWDPSGGWKVEKILAEADYLLVNETEARALSGRTDPADAARALARRVDTAVVKAGPAGAFAARGASLWHVRAPRVKVVDSTGAGDTFNAGFVDAILEGRPIDRALAFGCACGTLSTTRPGGYEGQPSRGAAERLMRMGS